MGTLPYMKFYIADWIKGTRILNHRIKGYYIDLLCLIWDKGTLGELIIGPVQLANLWSIPNDYFDENSNSEWESQVEEILIQIENIWGIEFSKVNRGKLYRIYQERIARDQKELIDNANRQNRYKKGNALGNGRGNAEVTPKILDVRSQKIDKDSSGSTKNADPHPPPALIPKEPKPLTDVQRIVTAWKMLTGYPKEDSSWDKLNFARCSKSAKSLLEFIGDPGNVIDCMQDIYEKLNGKGLTVTIETIVKHASDWKKDRMERRPSGVLLS